MGDGISKFDLVSPANIPKTKKRMDGSSKLFIRVPFLEILRYSKY
jgi:hypothetical protein